MTKSQKEFVVKSYAKYFGRAADADTIKYYGEKDNGKAEKASKVLNNIIADAGVYKGDIPDKQVVNEAFQNLFGRDAYTTEMNKYIKFVEKGKDLPINSIVKSAAKTDKAVYNNKMAVAFKYAELGGKGDLDLSKISKGNLIDLNFLNTVTKAADLKAKVYDLPENSGVPSAFDGKTYTLTANADTGKDFVGTAKDDTFLSASTNHWGVGDSIDGGKGVDTLKIIDTLAITQTKVIPTGSTIKNVEILDLISGDNVNADTTSIDGLTLLNIISKTTTANADNSATASATTDIRVTDTNADTTDAANIITVDGGKDVTVVSKNNGGAADTTSKDAITVGGTTAAAGNVTVTSTGAATTATASTTMGAITVNGGTTVTVDQNVGTTTLNSTNVGGIVTVNGNASTTTVTVNQTTTNTASATVVGYTAGAVDINDKNTAAADASTIETVIIKNAGAVTIDSGALKTLNLEGKITSVDADDAVVKTAGKVETLALNLNGVTTTAAVTADAQVTTLNVNSSTTASTLNDLVAAGATTVNVAGDAALTLTNNTFGAATAINVTNTAGVSFGTAIAAGTTFTGGAGNDTIILAGAQTKAITMGAGNDKVTYAGALGTGGSVAAGEGNDTIVMTVANALLADDNSTFNTTFTGFETLELNTSAAGTINLTGINGVSTVVMATGVGHTIVLDNLVSNGKVKLNASATAGSLTIGVKDALLTNKDVLNLELSNTAILNAGTIVAANVETININVADAATLGSAAVIHTASLTLADATTIAVAGNNGLDLSTSAAFTKVTNFDASGVVANNTATTTDTAINLAVTFTSGNTDVAANVTIKGGAGNDTLTGNAAIDTITGGAGNDTLTGAGGADIINVGEGRDVVVIGATDSTTASFDSINGFTLATKTALFTNQTTFLGGTTEGGSNVSILDIASSAALGAVTIKADITAAAGQAAGVTFTIKDGILTVGGAGASTVDTLGEWFTEANAALGGTAGASIAFEFGSDTYVYTESAGTDILVKLVGVTDANALVNGYTTATTVDNTILIG